ncbi:MAG TPA: hypothetical protein VIJ46_03925, partial [Rhabdochlamydiaceae bacterium]
MSLQPITPPVAVSTPSLIDRFSQNAQPITVTSALVAGVALVFFEVISWVAVASVVTSVAVCYLASRYIQVIYPGASPSPFGLYMLSVAQKVWQCIQSVLAWITAFFKGEERLPIQPPPIINNPIPAGDGAAPPVLPVPEVELNTDPAVEEAAVGRELSLVVPASRQVSVRSDRLNLQSLAQRVHWIRPQDVPLDLRAGMPSTDAHIGVLNLPRELYDAFVPRIFGTPSVPMLEYSQDPELPSFLFDNTVPLAGLENSGAFSEVEEASASLEDSITSSWVKIPSADPTWCERRREE